MIFTTIHVDGGSFVDPPDYKFHDAYFSVVNDKGELVHFEKNIGDHHSLIAEYKAIEWAIKNIIGRPLKILSDCTIAINWAKKGKEPTPKIPYSLPILLDGSEIIVEYKHNNLADKWNAMNHSPKKEKDFYIKRYYLNRKIKSAQS